MRKILFCKILALVFIGGLLTLVPSAQAAAITSAQTGNWSDTTTWTGGVVPGSSDSATVAAGHTVTITGTNPAISVAGVTVDGTLNMGSAVLTNTGGWTVTGTVDAGTSTVVLRPGWQQAGLPIQGSGS